LGEERAEKIVEAGREIIDRAIEGKGTTFRSFSSNHEAGNFQNMLAVYDQ
jgi:formamidopyrimidine-DNA glycosylase